MLDNSNKLVISDDAELDVLEAFLWYEEQRPELGISFLKEVDLSLVTIVKQPEYYHFLKLDTRAFLNEKIPLFNYLSF